MPTHNFHHLLVPHSSLDRGEIIIAGSGSSLAKESINKLDWPILAVSSAIRGWYKNESMRQPDYWCVADHIDKHHYPEAEEAFYDRSIIKILPQNVAVADKGRFKGTRPPASAISFCWPRPRPFSFRSTNIAFMWAISQGFTKLYLTGIDLCNYANAHYGDRLTTENEQTWHHPTIIEPLQMMVDDPRTRVQFISWSKISLLNDLDKKYCKYEDPPF